MHQRKTMQVFVDRFFGPHFENSASTEHTRQMLEPAIRDIVCRVIRRRQASSLLERHILALADQASTEAFDVSHVDQNQLIEKVCEQIRDFLVSEITNFVTTEKQTANTIDRRREETMVAIY